MQVLQNTKGIQGGEGRRSKSLSAAEDRECFISTHDTAKEFLKPYFNNRKIKGSKGKFLNGLVRELSRFLSFSIN